MSTDIECIDIILHELHILNRSIYNIALFKSKSNNTYREIETKIYKRFFSKIDPIILLNKSDRLHTILDTINAKLMNVDMIYPELFDEDIKKLKVLKYILEQQSK
jgi:hypothetical protein